MGSASPPHQQQAVMEGAGVSGESPCGVDVLSWGGETLVLHLACHEMMSIWD